LTSRESVRDSRVPSGTLRQVLHGCRPTGVSNPVCYPRFRSSASVLVQEVAFATGVPTQMNWRGPAQAVEHVV
jgi:hypothetical protein